MSLLCKEEGLRGEQVREDKTHCWPANGVLNITRTMFGWFDLPQLVDQEEDNHIKYIEQLEITSLRPRP